MKTIYKFDAFIRDEFEVEMAAGAEVLCVAVQDGEPRIWALVDTDKDKVKRRFHWRGTGHQCDGLGRYVGTVFLFGGSLVFHLFEAPTTEPAR